MSRRTATKTELVSALIMLIVAAIMLTSSSFAWYTISRSATVQAPTISMQATQNLEIARAMNVRNISKTSGGATYSDVLCTIPAEVNVGQAGKYECWGAVVAGFHLFQTVNPAEWNDETSTVAIRSYGSDGRKSGLTDAVPTDFNSNGECEYVADGVTAAASRLIWIRTNTAGSIRLVTGACKYLTRSATSTGALTEEYVSEHGITLTTTDTGLSFAMKVYSPITWIENGNRYQGVYRKMDDGYNGMGSWRGQAYLDNQGRTRFGIQFNAEANVPYLVELICFYDGDYYDDDDAFSDEVTTYFIDSFHWTNSNIN